MKILLTTLNSKYIHTNLAIRILYEQNKNFENLQFKEFTIKDNFDKVAEFCSGYELVAFSCYIWNIEQTLSVCNKIKLLNAECLILLGGPEVSYDFETIIKKNEIDFIIRGEGEIPFKRFLSDYPNLENVTDLILKNGNEIIVNKPQEMFDVNQLTEINPFANDNPAELTNKIAYFETSRGCPYKCAYCLAGLDNKLRFISFELLKPNLLYLIENAKIIKFLDRTFNADQNFAISILDFLLKNHNPDNIFQFEIKADIYQPKLIKFVNENFTKGTFRFEIGIQTLNSKSNALVNRTQNYENIKRFVKEVKDKVEIHLDLIVGLPYDYFEDVKFTFEEVFKLYAPELQLGFLKFLKGTPIRQYTEIHEYFYDEKAPYEIVESKYLSTNELDSIRIVENALDVYWNKKRAINTLIYVAENYSIFDFLFGLGQLFKQSFESKQYGINEIYKCLKDFIDSKYKSDQIVQQLLSIDFYLYHKVKPSPIFMQEIERNKKHLLLKQNKFNPQKNRYICLKLSFDFYNFVNTRQIIEKENIMIIQYNGTQKPKFFVSKTNK